MDLQLRCIATHPRGDNPATPLDFAFSSRSPRLVLACGDLLIDQSTSTNAIRATIRAPSQIDKLLYVGGSCSFMAFMDNGYVVSYAERLSSLQLVDERKISGTGRSVTLGEGSASGRFALFCKAESPSLWCLHVDENGALMEPFKLRSDIEGDQDNVNFVGGVFAKVRGKVTTKPNARICPIVAIATHPTLPLAAAAYTNGILRVWDVARKEQRSHFDAQLLMSERIVDLALHPNLPIIVICTSQGRVMTFYVKNVLYKRGDDPVLATSKTRDRKRRFQAMCFMPGFPAYLMLLTASRRIITRLVDKGSLIVGSSRYAKASKPLSIIKGAVLGDGHASTLSDDTDETLATSSGHARLSCEPAFGLVAFSFGNSSRVYIFQAKTDGLPGIRRPLSCGLDTSFSSVPGNAFKGPVIVHSDSLIAHKGTLLRYELGSEQTSKLCQLPPGDCHRIEVARDEYGYSIAALVFYNGDDEVNPAHGYEEIEKSPRYVLCTRRGDGETWNASEPGEGRAGCFLNPVGRQDRIIILAPTGTIVSLISFSGSQQREGGLSARQSRGVQRFSLDGRRATKAFRTPFASWSAVMYHDMDAKQLCVSRNAVGYSDPSGSLQSGSSHVPDREFCMDTGRVLALREKEVLIDVRWQNLLSGRQQDEYVGAIMTDKRIYFVRGVLQPISVFEFQFVDRMVVPFSPPSFGWVGPAVIVLFGNSLFSVSLDGRPDFIAGVSHGENVTALVAALPDRIVYARPSPRHAANALSITSRPYSAMSGVLRGMLTLSDRTSQNGPRYPEKVRNVLELQDVSQGSIELTKALIANDLSPIAYLLAVSQQGKLSMPPLRRAVFLGQMGDIRGALVIAEEEYSRLTAANAFHDGSELYRLLQRVLNMAFASGDFTAGRRCSALLGRKGVCSAFLDMEGGYAAVTSVAEFARARGITKVVDSLGPLIEKSARSSVATDVSAIPSQRELQSIRRAIQAVDLSSIPLGTRDKSQVFISTPPGEGVDGLHMPASQSELPSVIPGGVSDRLEMYGTEVTFEMSQASEGEHIDLVEEETDMSLPGGDTAGDAKASIVSHGGEFEDSSDEDGLFAVDGSKILNIPSARSSESANIHGTAVPDTVQQQAELLHNNVQQLKDHTAGPVQSGRENTHELLSAQRLTETTGQTAAAVRASDLLDRGIRKLDDERLSSAQKHFESALRVIARGWQNVQSTPVELIHELVYYKLVAQVRVAMEEIRTSSHSNTAAGQRTYSQLATAISVIPLRRKHRIEVLVLAVDGNMMIGNFGVAAQAMQAIKDLGVPDPLRSSLRDKYEACSARAFSNTQTHSIPRICYRTLREIAPGVRILECDVCPGNFLPNSGLKAAEVCPNCGCGTVKMH